MLLVYSKKSLSELNNQKIPEASTISEDSLQKSFTFLTESNPTIFLYIFLKKFPQEIDSG